MDGEELFHWSGKAGVERSVCRLLRCVDERLNVKQWTVNYQLTTSSVNLNVSVNLASSYTGHCRHSSLVS